MALTPINFTVDVEVDEVVTDDIAQSEPSRTWKLDLENGTIGRPIDGKEAIRQFILKAIGTARNRYLIYNDEYGSEIQDFIGQTLTTELASVEVPRLVREAIMYDDRIADVPNVDVKQTNDDVFINVTVELVDGEFLTVENVSMDILHQVTNTTSTISTASASVSVHGQTVTIYPE